MTVTLTDDATNARVRISATGLAAANYATVERSIDQVTWTFCRGGLNVAVTGSGFVQPLDDYEFIPGKVNYYRVRGISTGLISFVSAGTAATAPGNTGPITPGLPAGMLAGDLVLIFASNRSQPIVGADTPTNWTALATLSNGVIYGRVYDGVWTMPGVTFSNGVINEDNIAQSAAFRNAGLNAASSALLSNSSAQNINTPALNPPTDNLLIIVAGFKQDDWINVATLAGFTEIQETVSTGGNDSGQVWDYQIQTTKVNLSTSSFVVSGGAAATSRSIALALSHADYLNQQINSVTPTLTSVWLKSTTRPFLNQKVTVVDPGDNSSQNRSGANNVVNRTYAIATTDLRGGQQFPIQLRTTTAQDAQNLNYILASGDVLFLHVPATHNWPGGYILVGDVSGHRSFPANVPQVWTLNCQQVAAPGPDQVYAMSTWQSVLAAYPTWQDVLNAFPTWKDLLALVGNPSEVIVS